VGCVDYKAICDREPEYQELCAMPHATEYYVQSDCQHNQMLAAVNRVACVWPVADRLTGPRKIAKLLGAYLGHRSKLEFSDWGQKYTGSKRARYLQAVQSLGEKPIGRRDTTISAFVKLEKLSDWKKDPRMIQARGARYNVELGNYLKSFEHDLYMLSGSRHMRKVLPPGRCVVKGMNPNGRAALLYKHWTSLVKPVQLALDCSRFDGHVGVDVLRLEHSVYRSCFPRDGYLQKLLDYQLRNTCYTRSGLRYVVEGRRMSGDMNTALGNCVLMVIFIAAAMKQLRIPLKSWRMADDGDDCCLMVDGAYASLVASELPKLFLGYGQELKIESKATEFSQVTLCGSRVIRVGGVRRSILNPKRTIGKSRVSVKVRSERVRADYVATVGSCLLALHSGVPVLQSHALALQRASKNRLRDLPEAYVYKLAFMEDPFCVLPAVITDEARADFADSFGVGVNEQIEIETWFDTLTPAQLLGLAPPREVPFECYCYE
jgi:hypothetical protein